MRKREEIEGGLNDAVAKCQTAQEITVMVGTYQLNVLLDLRDQNAQIISLLSERHTRREKVEKCRWCSDTKEVTDYVNRGEEKLVPVKVPCPSCQPAKDICTCTHIKVGDCVKDYGCDCKIHA